MRDPDAKLEARRLWNMAAAWAKLAGPEYAAGVEMACWLRL